jgi:hypothetical protein
MTKMMAWGNICTLRAPEKPSGAQQKGGTDTPKKLRNTLSSKKLRKFKNI